MIQLFLTNEQAIALAIHLDGRRVVPVEKDAQHLSAIKEKLAAELDNARHIQQCVMPQHLGRVTEGLGGK